MSVLLLIGVGIDGRDGALAVVVGSLVAIIPNAYFALQSFRHKADVDPVKAFAAMYRGETGKLVLVMVLCALSFRYIDFHNPLLFFVALFVMLIVQAIASAIVISANDAETIAKLQQDEIDRDNLNGR